MSREQMIKEARTIEAMKNGFMGLEGKFSLISKYLGQPIMQQGSSMFNQTYLSDPYEITDPDDIPIMEEDENSYEVGLQFDGLSRGMNLSIFIQYHLREITVRYMGKIVYKEVSGELEGYAPNNEWEEKIENLYKFCKKIEAKKRPFEKLKVAEENKKKKLQILDYLREKWGL